MKQKILLPLVLLALVLAGCRAASVGATSDAAVRTLPSFQSESLVDEQGAVVVSVEPINLDEPDDTLDFQVGMNTHSIDLSMDLAELATLTTDTGKTVQAVLWDAPRSGHHVSGLLSFPARVDSAAVLDGASTLTLIIRDVDAPERVFTWSLRG
jgi:hypothetical protein